MKYLKLYESVTSGKMLVKEYFDWTDDDFYFEEENEKDIEMNLKYGDMFLCTQNILDPTNHDISFKKGDNYYFVDIKDGKVILRDFAGYNKSVSFSGLSNLFRKGRKY